MAASPLFSFPLCSSKPKVSLLKDPCVSWRPEEQRTSSGAKRMALSCSSIGSDPRFDKNLRAQSSMAALSLTEDEVLMPKRSFQWQRVLLKVSGEALAGDGSHNVDPEITMSIAREVAAVTRLGIEVAIVVGGGNFFRGSSWAGCSGLDRSSADHIGYDKFNLLQHLCLTNIHEDQFF
ncbi:Uridylate kinase [Nymphaea thermarum]|nr:Uridylate kinase [Nymphaea thermarum]